MLQAATEDNVRDALQQIVPIAIGAVIAIAVIYIVFSSARDRLGSIVREPVLLVGPLIAFAVVGFISFVIGASLLLALGIGAGAAVILLLAFTS